jgi:hypothetical protein
MLFRETAFAPYVFVMTTTAILNCAYVYVCMYIYIYVVFNTKENIQAFSTFKKQDFQPIPIILIPHITVIRLDIISKTWLIALL